MTPLVIPAFLSGAPGGGEILVLLAAALLLFGPRRLPGIARSIGRLMQELRRGADEFRDQVMRMDEDTFSAPPDEDDDVLTLPPGAYDEMTPPSGEDDDETPSPAG